MYVPLVVKYRIFGGCKVRFTFSADVLNCGKTGKCFTNEHNLHNLLQLETFNLFLLPNPIYCNCHHLIFEMDISIRIKIT